MLMDLRRLLPASFSAGRFADDPERSVEIVDTETEEELDRFLFGPPRVSGSSLCLSRLRPLSSSAFASCSSAMPFLGRC